MKSLEPISRNELSELDNAAIDVFVQYARKLHDGRVRLAGAAVLTWSADRVGHILEDAGYKPQGYTDDELQVILGAELTQPE